MVSEHLLFWATCVAIASFSLPRLLSRLRFKAGYGIALFLATSFASLWFAPKIEDLVPWAISSGIATTMSTREGVGFFEYLGRYLLLYGNLPLAALALTAVLGGRSKIKIPHLNRFLWIWLVAGPVVLAAFPFQQNGNMIYFLGSASLLIIPLIQAAADPAKKRTGIRHGMLLATAAWLFLSISHSFFRAR